MAVVKLSHTWADGSCTGASVEVRDSYPDSLDQARVIAKAALKDALAVVGEEDGEAP